MPRGGRRSSGRSSSPMFSKPAPKPSVPATRQASSVAPQPSSQMQPKQPGLFGQMASTAAGVAIGSTVGHVIGGALVGGGGHGSEDAAQQQQVSPYQQQAAPYQPQMSQGQQQNPCQYELQQFVECAQNNSDMNMCQGFNEALRQCKLYNGLA
ncbi:coiled-coil-helix-coiled-coil-helix domain-containing protein 2 [Nematostella vectensis]|uniref:coiled-coil-helix-coiled-coil-helix domain-containing protein 2 n=1 Tax=Nematostella vectensis TaxID=45351 RepID=UPI0013900FDB|nr:coiled-coil-helix-coiled-coil-helix domain-containing protein 2 [Nematostella vectensis]